MTRLLTITAIICLSPILLAIAVFALIATGGRVARDDFYDRQPTEVQGA